VLLSESFVAQACNTIWRIGGAIKAAVSAVRASCNHWPAIVLFEALLDACLTGAAIFTATPNISEIHRQLIIDYSFEDG
jgi:hypothetical protein